MSSIEGLTATAPPLELGTVLLLLLVLLFQYLSEGNKGRPENPKPPLGVVSATPLGPWGRPSHPLVPKGMATATPSFFFLFSFFFLKNIFF
jgi:hypothetical protein